MTDPAPSPPAGQPPVPVRPMPRLGGGLVWSDVLAKIEADQRARDPEPVAELTDHSSTPSLGATGSSLGVEAPVVDVTKPGFGIVSIEEARSWGITPPPAVELLAMADDLNAHGGLDETFVAGLLREVAVDDPPPVTVTKPASYDDIVDNIRRLSDAMPPPLEPIKLTREQIDAIPKAPPRKPWELDPTFFGTPIELVDTVEESTPYQLQAEAAGSENGGNAAGHMGVTCGLCGGSGVLNGKTCRNCGGSGNRRVTINDARERLGLSRLELEPAIPLPPRPGWLARTLRHLFT